MSFRYVHGSEKEKVESGEMDSGRATMEWDPEDSEQLRTQAEGKIFFRRHCQAWPPAPKKEGIKMTLPQWLSALLFVLFLLAAMILATVITG